MKYSIRKLGMCHTHTRVRVSVYKNQVGCHSSVFSACFISDKIAIPDFGTGAMENWGLVTYRETNLLYDERESSSYNKQRVASVIAHELVHQVCTSWRIKGPDERVAKGTHDTFQKIC